MSQAANQTWISLLNYSAKYGVSLSTLRRRIKDNTLFHKFEAGRYLVLDQPLSTPVQNTSHAQKSAGYSPHYSTQGPVPMTTPQGYPAPNQVPVPTQVPSIQGLSEVSILTSAHNLVEELKSAYARILQEKEEQISQLKEEILDLRMLVRILEEQVNHLRFNELASSDPHASEIDQSQF